MDDNEEPVLNDHYPRMNEQPLDVGGEEEQPLDVGGEEEQPWGDCLEAPVRDGKVSPTDYVWWWCDEGPEHLVASRHWGNIIEYPQYYSIEKPEVLVTYLDEEGNA